MKTRSTVAGALALGLLLGTSAAPVYADRSVSSPSAEGPGSPTAGRRGASGAAAMAQRDEIVVTFDPGATAAERDRVHRQLGAKRVQTVYRGSSTEGAVEVIDLPAGSSEGRAMAVADVAADVAVAEPNARYYVRHYANDPYYLDGSLWGMYGRSTTPSNDFGSRAAAAWSNGFTGSKDVYVAVLDEGIDLKHPDLAANIWTNPYDPVDGIDNDGNGYVDDIHGWDFVGNQATQPKGDNTVYDPDPATSQEVDAHGTHVAGTIGAVGDNGMGVAGVNWNVTIIPLKFLAWEGGTSSNAARAIYYLVDLKMRHPEMNIVAINASWGGREHPTFLEDAIRVAGSNGILFVNAVGEACCTAADKGANSDIVDDYPAKYDCRVTYGNEPFDCMVAVTVLLKTGRRAYWANWGRKTVDLAAPGVRICSTVPYVGTTTNPALGAGYDCLTGTSMATAFVSGAIALYYAARPAATPRQVRRALFSSTTRTKDFVGLTVTGGRLDVNTMLRS